MLRFIHTEHVTAVKWQNVRKSLIFTIFVNNMFRGKLTHTNNLNR